ncbi:unnamed protein product [Brachionus calyciflorus]|uniref:BZIP domain-containing protein n=1 Tax=Brachionus calyciflorus TaxID=104777 RepID=A0A813PVM7_9BILA|nr:unnamed protein product [Brachionus calyciflorus]
MNIESTSSNFTSTDNQNESLEEKKRKLTLKLNNIEMGSNPNSSNSMSSTDSANDLNLLNSSNKKYRPNYFVENIGFNQQMTDQNRNRDLLSNLDLPTPHLEKLEEKLIFNSSVLKTPGSALDIFTPSIESAFSNAFTINSRNAITLTPIDQSNKTIHNFLNSNNLFGVDMSQDKSGGQTPSLLINPMNIFGATNLISTDNNQSETDNTPKYSNLTNVCQNNSTYLVQPANNNISNNNLQTNLDGNNQNQNNILVYQNLTVSNNNKKDEPQTVPVHSNMLINHQKMMNGSNYTEMKKEPMILNMDTAGAIGDRRSTDKSTTSSTGDAFSPVNYADQDDLKLEKKRERNREAARKCRTRKLQKIADLEQKVKILTDSNNEQKNKNKALMDEINEIKLKLQTHQKAHNCDLKLDLFTS